MPADPLDVITLAEAKSALNIGTTISKHDAELEGWITAVSNRLDRLVGPVVKRTITAELHDGGTGVVFTRFHPVDSVTSVTEYEDGIGTTLTAETTLTAPQDGYLLRYGRSIRRRSLGADATFPCGRSNVSVTYSAGRFTATADVTYRYRKAAGLILANLWRSQQESRSQYDEFSVAQQNFPRFTIPNAVRDMLHGEVQEPRHLIA